MNCKHCQAELEEGVSVCPACGADNALCEEEAVTEAPAEIETEAPEEAAAEAVNEQPELSAPIQEGVKATPAKMALAVAAVLVLIAVFVALIASGLGLFDSGDTTEPTVATDITDVTDATDASEETVPATTPADTGLNDVTCKGTYTVSDADAAAAMDTVVARLGDRELTNSQLQAYYWLQVRIFVSNNYYYLSMLGFDYTQPLDTQMIDSVTASYIGSDVYDITWQQYFLQNALDAWHTYGSLICTAEAAGYELTAEDLEYLNSLDALLESDAQTNGFESVEAMVLYLMGPGADAEDYKDYETSYYHSYSYYVDTVTGTEYTAEELEAYFEENAEAYAASGITKETCTVDVRHILIMPEGATSSTIRTETFPQEAWDASKVKAEQLLQEWLAGEKTEESFAAMANEHSQDTTDTDYDGVPDSGGLYEGVAEGDMVTNFNDWCFDAARQVGDYGIVETEFGYHIMYFCGKDYLWSAYVEEDLRSQAADTLVTTALETYPMEVDYASIVLGFVDLTT